MPFEPEIDAKIDKNHSGNLETILNEILRVLKQIELNTKSNP